jgi:hypothetical protein
VDFYGDVAVIDWALQGWWLKSGLLLIMMS